MILRQSAEPSGCVAGSKSASGCILDRTGKLGREIPVDMLSRTWLAALLFAASAFSQCTGDWGEWWTDFLRVPKDRPDLRAAALEKWLAREPTNYFLLERVADFMFWDLREEDTLRKGLMKRLVQLREEHSDSPEIAVVYARAIYTTEPAKALAVLESAEESSPGFPFTHTQLLVLFQPGGDFANQVRLREEVEMYLKLCPGVDSYYAQIAYQHLASLGSREQVAKFAPVLRASLEAKKPVSNQYSMYPLLWDMELKVAALDAVSAVRERISRDLAKLEELSGREPNLAGFYADIARKGFAMIGETAAFERIDRRNPPVQWEPHEPAGALNWAKPKDSLPTFSSPDLNGKVWKLSDLHGKALLINVWATWCAPCRAEHPEFQKLYEKLKDRKDIAVLSVSVDDLASLVSPYMKENHYTFPVLVDDALKFFVASQGVIPQNWLVSPEGRLAAIQFGYSAVPEWTDKIIAKLDELAKAAR